MGLIKNMNKKRLTTEKANAAEINVGDFIIYYNEPHIIKRIDKLNMLVEAIQDSDRLHSELIAFNADKLFDKIIDR